MSVQLCCEPVFARPFDDLQSIVQQGQGLFNLPCDPACRREEGSIMGYIPLRPGGTVSGQTAADKRYPLRQSAIFNLDPAAKERSQRVPERETLLRRDCKHLVRALIQATLSPMSASSLAFAVRLDANVGR